MGDNRPPADPNNVSAWVELVSTMDAEALGQFERRTFAAWQHTSLVPLRIAIVNRREELERGRSFRIKPKRRRAMRR